MSSGQREGVVMENGVVGNGVWRQRRKEGIERNINERQKGRRRKQQRWCEELRGKEEEKAEERRRLRRARERESSSKAGTGRKDGARLEEEEEKEDEEGDDEILSADWRLSTNILLSSTLLRCGVLYGVHTCTSTSRLSSLTSSLIFLILSISHKPHATTCYMLHTYTYL